MATEPTFTDPTCFPDFTLANGRTITHARLRNGSQGARFVDGGTMSDAEWVEYCEKLNAWNLQRVAAEQRARKARSLEAFNARKR